MDIISLEDLKAKHSMPIKDRAVKEVEDCKQHFLLRASSAISKGETSFILYASQEHSLTLAVYEILISELSEKGYYSTFNFDCGWYNITVSWS
jgi:hypothetical protein